MKKLLNTLYVTTPDSCLSLDGENVVIKRDNAEVGRLPLHNLESILMFGYAGASPALMGACVKQNIDLCFLNPNGKFLARIVGESYGNVLLRKTQFRNSDSQSDCLRISKSMITGKLYNSRKVIDRTLRDHAIKTDVSRLDNAKNQLANALENVQAAQTLEELRGVEGEAAKIYFGVFDHLIIS